MALKLTAESFLTVVRQSNLVAPDLLKRLLDEFGQQGGDPEDSKAIADALIEKKALTSWQAEKLLQGKHKGFFLGKYRLLSLLGKGGMSSVYLAEHVLMRRRCAIKVLPAKRVKDTSYLGRFHREAQAVAALDHMNIVRAYDVDKESEKDMEVHFLVMEYVEGQSLHDMVQKKGTFSYEEGAEYFRQAAHGLAHAHKAGMVHRDIKPGNLLVDTNGVVKILDLGLARFFAESDEESLTVAHDEKVLGTADYLAPEQALDSHKVDARADIYSLGCTFYFCLTGHPPFTEGTLAQRLMAHQTRQPPSLTKDRPDAPPDLVEIIEKMMAKKTDARFQSAEEVAIALTEWLSHHGSDRWRNSVFPGAPRSSARSTSDPSPEIATPSPSKPGSAPGGGPTSDRVAASMAVGGGEGATSPFDISVPPHQLPIGAFDFSQPVARAAAQPMTGHPTSGAASPNIPTAEPTNTTRAETVGNLSASPVTSESEISNPLTSFLSNLDTGKLSSTPLVKPSSSKIRRERKSGIAIQPPAAIPLTGEQGANSFPGDPPVAVPVAGPGPGSGPAAVPVATAVPVPMAVPVATPVSMGQHVVTNPGVAPPVSPTPPTAASPENPFANLGGIPSGDSPFAGLAQTSGSGSYSSTRSKPRAKGPPLRDKSASGSTKFDVQKLKVLWRENRNLRIGVMAGGAVLLLALGAYAMRGLFKGKGTAPSSETVAAIPDDGSFVVGPGQKYETIGAAIKAVQSKDESLSKTKNPTYPQEYLIRVLGGETYRESIDFDNSTGSGVYLSSPIRISSEGESRAILTGSGSGPIVRILATGDVVIEGFDIKADGKKTAIELSGLMTSTTLRNLRVSGFSESGVLARDVSGFGSGSEVTLDTLSFKAGSSSAAAITFSGSKVADFIVRRCKFVGPMSAGVAANGASSGVTFQDCVFSNTTVGVRFAAGQTYRTLSVENCTFHKLTNGIVFSGPLASDSSEIKISKNIFTDVSGPDVVMTTGFNATAFSAMLINSTDNWTSKSAVPAGGVATLYSTGKQGASFQFASTEPANAAFLLSKSGSSQQTVGARPVGK